jgi:hypothetical protein
VEAFVEVNAAGYIPKLWNNAATAPEEECENFIFPLTAAVKTITTWCSSPSLNTFETSVCEVLCTPFI